MKINKVRALMPLVLAGALAGCQTKNTAIHKDPTAPVAPAKKTVWPPNYEYFIAHTIAVKNINLKNYGCVGVGDSFDRDFNGTEASAVENVRQAMFSAHRSYFSSCRLATAGDKQPTIAKSIDPKEPNSPLYMTIAGSDGVVDSYILIYRQDKLFHATAIAADGIAMVKAGGKLNTFVGTMTAEGCTPTIPDLSLLLILRGK
ncbi:MAG: hypothetical protein WCW67_08380 [Candidatus Margulisiibacteriota bacterium]|jgi:hypothetical protein